MVRQKLIEYSLARNQIADGDLLLYRRAGVIAACGRSVYSHAAMAAWWRGTVLLCLEVAPVVGGRAVCLSQSVARHPGRWDVYRISVLQAGKWNPEAAVEAMMRMSGTPYGWRNLIGTVLRHIPGLRLFVRPDMDDYTESKWPPFCSQAVSRAMSRGGVDPVPNLPHRLTEPGDLARSACCRYCFTLKGQP